MEQGQCLELVVCASGGLDGVPDQQIVLAVWEQGGRVRQGRNQFSQAVNARGQKRSLFHGLTFHGFVGAVVNFSNLAPKGFKRFGNGGKKGFRLVFGNQAKAVWAGFGDVAVKAVRFAGGGVDAANDVLLALGQHLDQLFHAIVINEANPHLAEGFLGAVHQKGFGVAADTDGGGAKMAERLGLNHFG